MATGEYYYQTSGDGYCGYATKKAALRNATRAAKEECISVTVYSPSGKEVAHIDGRDIVKKIEAEISDADFAV